MGLREPPGEMAGLAGVVVGADEAVEAGGGGQDTLAAAVTGVADRHGEVFAAAGRVGWVRGGRLATYLFSPGVGPASD